MALGPVTGYDWNGVFSPYAVTPATVARMAVYRAQGADRSHSMPVSKSACSPSSKSTVLASTKMRSPQTRGLLDLHTWMIQICPKHPHGTLEYIGVVRLKRGLPGVYTFPVPGHLAVSEINDQNATVTV